MIRRTFFQALLLTAVSYVTAFAQTDFFWSFQDLNSGATNSDAEGVFAPGESDSLFLYYTTNGPIDSDMGTGFFLDIASSSPGAINITGSEVFNFDVDGDDRWSIVFPGKIAGDMESIDELGAFTLACIDGNCGIHDHTAAFDAGYDAGADAFLMARIDFTYLGGFTEIVTTEGDGGIVNDGRSIFPSFGGTSISGIPEPTGTALVVIAISGMALRRKNC